MDQIIVKEKPDNISFDDIHEVLEKAHEINNRNGFVMRTASLNGEQIKERIGKDGVCFVALDGDKLIGTISVRFIKRDTWYAKRIYSRLYVSRSDSRISGETY